MSYITSLNHVTHANHRLIQNRAKPTPSSVCLGAKNTCSFGALAPRPPIDRLFSLSQLQECFEYFSSKAQETYSKLRKKLTTKAPYYPQFLDDPRLVERWAKKSEAYRAAYEERIANGTYNKEPIWFQPAKTMEDALRYTRENGLVGTRICGARRNSPRDLEIVNTINGSLCFIHNMTRGRAFMPRTIILRSKLSAEDGLMAAGGYVHVGDFMLISRSSKIRPYIIYHEVGHANHSLRVPFPKGNESQYSPEINKIFDSNKNLIRETLDEYATTNPYEFVATCFESMISGMKLPKQLAELYTLLGGPDIVKPLR